jgi:sensor histidine kinase regulating citrate/malate metabolism
MMSLIADRRISAYQNELMRSHLTEVENIYRQMRGWRHDYHNHIQAMLAHLSLGQLDELLDYLQKLSGDLINLDTVLKTGNVMVDAIISSKISLAASKNITVNAKANVPHDIPISEIDLCVILGNLIDNAMEACVKTTDGGAPFIRIYIGKYKEMLYLSVQNTASGAIRKIGHSYLTTKTNETGFHGLGIVRVDRIVHKYGGYVNRQHEEGVFATEIMLPL